MVKLVPRNDLESNILAYYEMEKPLRTVLKHYQDKCAKGMLSKIANILTAAGYKGGQDPTIILRQADPKTIRTLEEIANGLPDKQRKAMLSKMYGQIGGGNLTVKNAVRDVLQFDQYTNSIELYDKGTKALRGVTEEAMLRGEYMVQKGVGIGWEVDAPGIKRVDAFIKRQWTQNDATEFLRPMSKIVEEQVSQSLLLGEHPDKLAARIRNVEEIDQVRANRMARTTVTAVSNKAHMDSYKRHGVKRYEFRAMFNERTCTECGRLDGKVFNLDDKQPGVNFPPIHPNCRCTTGAALSKEVKERMRQNAIKNGRDLPLRDKMTFEEWKAQSVKPASDKPAPKAEPKPKKESKPAPKKEVKAQKVTVDSYPSAFSRTPAEKKNTQKVADMMNACEGADPTVKNLYANMAKMETIEKKEIPFAVKHNKNSAVSTRTNMLTGELYDASISYPKIRDDNDKASLGTTLHEQMHLMDLYSRTDTDKAEGWFSSSDPELKEAWGKATKDIPEGTKAMFTEFHTAMKENQSALVEDAKNRSNELAVKLKNNEITVDEFSKQHKKIWDEVNEENDRFGREWGGGGVCMLEDIYDALSGGTYRDTGVVKYGHGSSYYRYQDSRIHETVANYGALKIMRPDLVETLKKDKPDLCKALDSMYEKMSKKWGITE